MSVDSIISDWNADPTVGKSSPQQLPDQQSSALKSNTVDQGQVSQQPTADQQPEQKSMVQLLSEKGVDVNSITPAKPVNTEQKSKAQEIEDLWRNDVGKSDGQKYMENLSPEEFKTEFMNRMSTMDIGERTNVEKFLFGDTAKKANPVQSFLRGIRGELTETGLGVKQRIEDVVGTDEETERKNELMRRQAKQQVKTEYPLTTTAGQIVGTAAEFAPLAVAGAGAVPLLAEGATYGLTRPQEKGYTAADVAMATGGEALLSLVGGKMTQKFVDMVSPLARKAYTKITGNSPKGSLVSDTGEPSQELIDALKLQGIEYDDLLDGAGVFDQMKQLLKAQPVGVEPEQAVRSARYEALGIEPTKSSVTQSFDDAMESQVLRRQINDPEAAALREALANESEGFKSALLKIADETGDPDIVGVGETIREAIKSRAKTQRIAKSEAYKNLADEASKTGDQIAIPADEIVQSWNSGKKIKRSQMQGFHADVKESLMRYGVIEPDEAFNKLVQKGEEEITPLSANNFESLRQELNANINPQDPTTSAILKPIISKLDESVDIATEGFDGGKALTDLSKTARGKAREYKQEFDSKTMVSDILKTKPGTFDTYSIRGQDIFNKLVKNSRKTPTSQQLNEVITALEKSGSKGKKAIADLNSATVMNLLNEATSQLSAKGMKGQQFSYTAFRKALEGIGDKEMDILFRGNPDALLQLKELGKAAKDSQTFFDAIPKGSAADIQNMFTRSFAPLFETVGFAKGGFLGKLAAQTLAEKAGDRLSKSKLRKAVAKEIKAKPEIRQELVKLTKQYPGVFEALGIASFDKATREDD
ncbi:hypothetical protein NVP1184A_17 [Vibrio phage 1.184.A._10N.286.49.A5]|nr:hypothetical protein NVP1184A_17 [Vibrio phage 1.184.A._10N.286.49.A5]